LLSTGPDVAREIFAEKNAGRQLRYTAVERKSTKRSDNRRRMSTIRHMPKYKYSAENTRMSDHSGRFTSHAGK